LRLVRAHTLTALAAAWLGAVGCGVVANLGDPKVLGPAPPSSTEDAGAPPSNVQAVSIAVGEAHACAVMQDDTGSPVNGTVRCWGANAQGELGSDPVATPVSWSPLAVEGLNSVESVALSANYSCAITTDHYLLCWGGVAGETENGVHREDSTVAYVPSQMDLHLEPLVPVASVSTGPSGGCAVFQQSLACWGDENYAPSSAVDAGVTELDGGVVIGDDNFQTAAVGSAHVCAIASRSGASDVECWGSNTNGQTGVDPEVNPFRVTRPTPVGLAAIDVAVQIVAGGNDSCALLRNKAVYCWGQNDRGQLGNPTLTMDSATPTLVNLGAGAVEIAIADSHACAVLDDRSVWCWGDNSVGQLGVGAGSPPFSATPMRVDKLVNGMPVPLISVNHIAAGGLTSCAIRYGDPHVWCWGANENGQTGQAPSNAVGFATAFSF
jgi:alpha-tubulin suppressor-like RCC1 family protein